MKVYTVSWASVSLGMPEHKPVLLRNTLNRHIVVCQEVIQAEPGIYMDRFGNEYGAGWEWIEVPE